MLALGEIGIDDVVVQEIRARARRHREELIARTMDEDGAQCADLGRDVDWHTGRYVGREAGSGTGEAGSALGSGSRANCNAPCDSPLPGSAARFPPPAS